MGVNNSYSFNLDVYDSPRFSSKLQPLYEVVISNELTIKLPVIEEFLPLDIINANMPSFATFKQPFSYTIYPKTKQDIGDFVIQGSLINKYKA